MPNKHPFHIVDNSPWPVMASINLMNLMVAFLAFSKTSNTKFLMLSFITMNSLALNSYCWWRDTSREGSLLGHHTHKVYKGLKIGISLFILSEIMFFMSFFWTFFHFSLAPDFEISNTWPPTGITPLNPYQIPLLNTTILLSSGVTITWAHNAIMMKKSLATKFALYLTIMLGMVFSSLQMWEYFWSSFSMNDSAFGSIFYLATGFHGLHVIIGTIFLITSLCRISTNLVNNKHHFNLEASAWYWHFVDVVWIFLYVFMYWWFFFLMKYFIMYFLMYY